MTVTRVVWCEGQQTLLPGRDDGCYGQLLTQETTNDDARDIAEAQGWHVLPDLCPHCRTKIHRGEMADRLKESAEERHQREAAKRQRTEAGR
jgi:hypothetical protein